MPDRVNRKWHGDASVGERPNHLHVLVESLSSEGGSSFSQWLLTVPGG